MLSIMTIIPQIKRPEWKVGIRSSASFFSASRKAPFSPAAAYAQLAHRDSKM
ncbi:hypothetical protein BDZ91DRAFT_749251, partial [Kalaharituber pfeilii]